ncbi:MAG: cell wall anchor protein, partial [SAR202 cluster bacterium]|nr:cell wall anchor protein [SAR202 cluster bacterium]
TPTPTLTPTSTPTSAPLTATPTPVVAVATLTPTPEAPSVGDPTVPAAAPIGLILALVLLLGGGALLWFRGTAR